MGILNLTPDSFSDGNRHSSPEAAIAAGLAMAAAGASIIDIGGESTRPGAEPVSPQEEISRIVPVISGLAGYGLVISADTRNAATMAAALDAGARIINDISGLHHDGDALGLIAARGCPVVLMHMRGTPETMNANSRYDHLVEDILAELTATRDAALAAGIMAKNIALDPGFGFAKLGSQNIELLKATPRFAALNHPLVIGVSRKKFIGALGIEENPAQRVPGSIAAGLFAVAQGAHILRAHDVAETVQALRVWQTLVAEEHGKDI